MGNLEMPVAYITSLESLAPLPKNPGGNAANAETLDSKHPLSAKTVLVWIIVTCLVAKANGALLPL